MQPSNCQENDFELPQGLISFFEQQELPPFITPELLTIFVSLRDGWTPGLAKTETPIVVRIAHLVDSMHWNCAAMYSSTWLDALTKQDPLFRTPVSFDEITFHESAPRLLCIVHGWAAIVNELQPMAYPTLAGILEGLFQFKDLTFGSNPEIDAAFDAETGQPNVEKLFF